MTEGEKVRHKLTGQDIFVLEIGPKMKKVFLGPGLGYQDKEYLAKGIVRVRLQDMRVVDIYEYEIEGIEVETGKKILLMENN